MLNIIIGCLIVAPPLAGSTHRGASGKAQLSVRLPSHVGYVGRSVLECRGSVPAAQSRKDSR